MATQWAADGAWAERDATFDLGVVALGVGFQAVKPGSLAGLSVFVSGLHRSSSCISLTNRLLSGPGRVVSNALAISM